MSSKFHGQITEKEWLEDFQDFVSSESILVPDAVSKKILQTVHRSLNPSSWFIFSKLLGIHAIVGTLSLAICDQFGMSPFKTGFSLSEYFMRFGHSVCMFLCGFMFLSLTVTAVAILLQPEEFKVLKKDVWVQVPSLAFLSLAVFVGLGDGMALGIAAFWLGGAIMGGLSFTFLQQLRWRHALPH